MSNSAGAAGLPAIPLVDDISYDVASSNASTIEPRTFWFLPEDLVLPSHGHGWKPPRNSGVIPKPRNAYALFRSHLGQKVLPTDIPFFAKQAIISRIASHVWRELPARERNRFEILFQEEQRLHQRLYPSYEIQDKSPSTILPKSKAKDVDGDEDSVKCKRIAELLLDNAERERIVTFVREGDKGGLQPGWFKLIAPVPSVSRCSSPRMDMEIVGAVVSTPAKTLVREPLKVVSPRVKHARVDAKHRSSTSTMCQSKAKMMRSPSLVSSPPSATPPCSGEIRIPTYADMGWDPTLVDTNTEALRHIRAGPSSWTFFHTHAYIGSEPPAAWHAVTIPHALPFDADNSLHTLEDAGHPGNYETNNAKDYITYTSFDIEYMIPSHSFYPRPPSPPFTWDDLITASFMERDKGEEYLVDDLVQSMEKQTISLP